MPFQEAMIVAATKWPRHDLLARISDNPVARLNRAIAVLFGAAKGLESLDTLIDNAR
jgi:predicted RNA polymerase sigma factor